MKDVRYVFEKWIRRNNPQYNLKRVASDNYSGLMTYEDPTVQTAWLAFASGWGWRAASE